MLIQQDNFIQRLLSLEKGRAVIPDIRKKRTWYLKKLTDAKLVKYIRRGNGHAFDVLIKRHEAKLKQIIRSNLFDKSNVDDMAQDVWEKVVHHVRSRTYKENGRFYGWLCTVAFHECMMANRKKKYSPDIVEYNPQFHDAEDSPEDSHDIQEIARAAKGIISTFNERDQQIIKMRIEEGMSFEAIAWKLNWKLRSVQSSNRRLMKKINMVLIEKGFKEAV